MSPDAPITQARTPTQYLVSNITSPSHHHHYQKPKTQSEANQENDIPTPSHPPPPNNAHQHHNPPPRPRQQRPRIRRRAILLQPIITTTAATTRAAPRKRKGKDEPGNPPPTNPLGLPNHQDAVGHAVPGGKPRVVRRLLADGHRGAERAAGRRTARVGGLCSTDSGGRGCPAGRGRATGGPGRDEHGHGDGVVGAIGVEIAN